MLASPLLLAESKGFCEELLKGLVKVGVAEIKGLIATTDGVAKGLPIVGETKALIEGVWEGLIKIETGGVIWITTLLFLVGTILKYRKVPPNPKRIKIRIIVINMKGNLLGLMKAVEGGEFCAGIFTDCWGGLVMTGADS